MWKLLKYMKAYKKEYGLHRCSSYLEALFELFVPLVMAKIIDIGIAQGDRPYIVRMCLLMAALGLIGLVCSITAQYFSAKAAVGFAARLRHELFAHIQSLSFSEMDVHGTSTLITRMTSDINQVQSGTNLFLRLFMRSPFIVFGAMIMAFDRCKSGSHICGGDPDFVCDCIWHHAREHSAVQEGAGAARQCNWHDA